MRRDGTFAGICVLIAIGATAATCLAVYYNIHGRPFASGLSFGVIAFAGFLYARVTNKHKESMMKRESEESRRRLRSTRVWLLSQTQPDADLLDGLAAAIESTIQSESPSQKAAKRKSANVGTMLAGLPGKFRWMLGTKGRAVVDLCVADLGRDRKCMLASGCGTWFIRYFLLRQVLRSVVAILWSTVQALQKQIAGAAKLIRQIISKR